MAAATHQLAHFLERLFGRWRRVLAFTLQQPSRDFSTGFVCSSKTKQTCDRHSRKKCFCLGLKGLEVIVAKVEIYIESLSA